MTSILSEYIHIHTYKTRQKYKRMYEKTEVIHGLKAGLEGNTGQGCLFSPGADQGVGQVTHQTAAELGVCCYSPSVGNLSCPHSSFVSRNYM